MLKEQKSFPSISGENNKDTRYARGSSTFAGFGKKAGSEEQKGIFNERPQMKGDVRAFDKLNDDKRVAQTKIRCTYESSPSPHETSKLAKPKEGLSVQEDSPHAVNRNVKKSLPPKVGPKPALTASTSGERHTFARNLKRKSVGRNASQPPPTTNLRKAKSCSESDLSNLHYGSKGLWKIFRRSTMSNSDLKEQYPTKQSKTPVLLSYKANKNSSPNGRVSQGDEVEKETLQPTNQQKLGKPDSGRNDNEDKRTPTGERENGTPSNSLNSASLTNSSSFDSKQEDSVYEERSKEDRWETELKHGCDHDDTTLELTKMEDTCSLELNSPSDKSETVSFLSYSESERESPQLGTFLGLDGDAFSFLMSTPKQHKPLNNEVITSESGTRDSFRVHSDRSLSASPFSRSKALPRSKRRNELSLPSPLVQTKMKTNTTPVPAEIVRIETPLGEISSGNGHNTPIPLRTVPEDIRVTQSNSTEETTPMYSSPIQQTPDCVAVQVSSSLRSPNPSSRKESDLLKNEEDLLTVGSASRLQVDSSPGCAPGEERWLDRDRVESCPEHSLKLSFKSSRSLSIPNQTLMVPGNFLCPPSLDGDVSQVIGKIGHGSPSPCRKKYNSESLPQDGDFVRPVKQIQSLPGCGSANLLLPQAHRSGFPVAAPPVCNIVKADTCTGDESDPGSSFQVLPALTVPHQSSFKIGPGSPSPCRKKYDSESFPQDGGFVKPYRRFQSLPGCGSANLLLPQAHRFGFPVCNVLDADTCPSDESDNSSSFQVLPAVTVPRQRALSDRLAHHTGAASAVNSVGKDLPKQRLETCPSISLRRPSVESPSYIVSEEVFLPFPDSRKASAGRFRFPSKEKFSPPMQRNGVSGTFPRRNMAQMSAFEYDSANDTSVPASPNEPDGPRFRFQPQEIERLPYDSPISMRIHQLQKQIRMEGDADDDVPDAAFSSETGLGLRWNSSESLGGNHSPSEHSRPNTRSPTPNMASGSIQRHGCMFEGSSALERRRNSLYDAISKSEKEIDSLRNITNMKESRPSNAKPTNPKKPLERKQTAGRILDFFRPKKRRPSLTGDEAATSSITLTASLIELNRNLPTQGSHKLKAYAETDLLWNHVVPCFDTYPINGEGSCIVTTTEHHHHHPTSEENCLKQPACGRFSQCSVMEAKRCCSIWELFRSEVVYFIDSLQVLQEVHYCVLEELQRSNFLMDVNRSKVFGNLRELCLSSEGMCTELLSLFTRHGPGQVAATAHVIKAFDNFAWRFDKPYSKYGENYYSSLKYVDSLLEQPDFQMYEEFCKNHPRSRKRGLKDFLIEPVQHLQRFLLVLKDIKKRGEEMRKNGRIPPEIEELQSAMMAIGVSCHHLESQLKLVELRQTALQLGETIRWPQLSEVDVKGYVPDALAHHWSFSMTLQSLSFDGEDRHLLHHGPLKLYERTASSSKPMSADLIVFLFSDVLLLTKVVQHNVYKKKSIATVTSPVNQAASFAGSDSQTKLSHHVYRPPYDVDQLVVIDIPDSETIERAFCLVEMNCFHQTVNILTLEAPTPKSKATWLEELSKVCENVDKLPHV